MTDHKKDRRLDAVEDSLQTLPLATAPVQLRTRVMQRVRSIQRVPPFAFPWLEAALSLLATSMVTVIVSLLLNLSPVTVQLFVQNLRRLFLGSAQAPLAAAILLGLGLMVFFIVVAAFLFADPRPKRIIVHRRIG